MNSKEIIVALIIHLIIPIFGLIMFLKLAIKMKSEMIYPPILEFFIIFATYGGLLLVVLTSIFWKWSGLASLGGFYLIMPAPILLGFIAYQQFRKRKISKYHNWAFRICVLYYIFVPLTILTILLTEPNWID